MSDITIWDTIDSKTKNIDFNHISSGFNPTVDHPTAVTIEQKTAWASKNWLPRAAQLVNHEVIEYTDRPLQAQAGPWEYAADVPQSLLDTLRKGKHNE